MSSSSQPVPLRSKLEAINFWTDDKTNRRNKASWVYIASPYTPRCGECDPTNDRKRRKGRSNQIDHQEPCFIKVKLVRDDPCTIKISGACLRCQSKKTKCNLAPELGVDDGGRSYLAYSGGILLPLSDEQYPQQPEGSSGLQDCLAQNGQDDLNEYNFPTLLCTNPPDMDANYDFMNSVGLKESDPPWLAETIKYPPAKEDMGDDPVDNHPTLIQHTVNLQATTRDPLDLTTSAEEPSWAETPSWAEVSKRFDEARDLQTSQLMEDGIDP